MSLLDPKPTPVRSSLRGLLADAGKQYSWAKRAPTKTLDRKGRLIMIPLPNDPKGRFWTVARKEDPKTERNSLVTLVTADDDGNIYVLGTGFVIYGHENTAICVGASHSFDEPKRRKLNRSGHHYLNVPPDFAKKGPSFFEPDEVFAFTVSDDEAVVCEIVSFNSIEDYDVAIFGLMAPERSNVFNWRFSLDLAVPRVGDEVSALVNHIKYSQLEAGRGKIKQDLHLRHGVVTDRIWDTKGARRLGGQGFIVRTTIPMPGGMSGSPVLWRSKEGSTALVWGVVSSDNSEPTSRENFCIPGDSAVSMLWPAMGLSVLTGSSYTLMGDLLKRGVFDNKSEKVTIETRGSTERIEILYRDTRDKPPSEVLLTTSGHPFLSSASD